ncbi:tyrosine-type recombinase/integrase [Aquidulcibacter sp.]|jgi:integrase|uniref:tyrosine-type recombinase/integrase n=1 Tax=Aquidulcibacter sp. TaxID=2052990 RepID=UPI0028AE6114|nr:tyrosine-type recombinase/integrase [Aquidulcibacter sp.]
MMAWAVSRKILVAHPTLGVVRYKIEKRERFISVDEVQKIFEATERLEKRGEVRSEFGLIIRLLILTGARRGEIQGLQWREVDLARRSIVLPDARSKTGARRIPLFQARGGQTPRAMKAARPSAPLPKHRAIRGSILNANRGSMLDAH